MERTNLAVKWMILSVREALFCWMIGEIDIYHAQTGIRNEPKEGCFPPPRLYYMYRWRTKISPGKQLIQISFFAIVVAICFKIFSPGELAIPPYPELSSFRIQVFNGRQSGELHISTPRQLHYGTKRTASKFMSR